MTAILIQALAVLTIGALAILLYQIDKPKLSIRNITIATMLVVLSVVLQFFSIMIPLFGFPSLRIDFLQLPLMILGALMGPMWGLIGGIVQDVLGLIVTPTNYPFFGFTLNKVLVGVIPGLVFLVHKKNENKSIKSFLLLLLSLFLVGSLTYLMTLESIVVNQQIVLITNWMKISIAILIILLIGGLIIVVLRSIKIIKSTPISLSYWMLSVILVELIVQLVLTPIWLVTMYQIPVLISFLLRVVKAAVMIPLMILIGYGALVLSDRLMKRRS